MSYSFKYLILLWMVFYKTPLFAQGVRFNNGPLENIIMEAREGNKPLFIEVSTDWCGPCKRLDKEILTKRSVGDLINTHFVSYKMNSEKAEGPDFVKHYRIKGYPTLLFIDPKGTLFYRFTGAPGDTTFFLQLVNEALKEYHASKSLIMWHQEYEAGNRDTGFLRKYILERSKVEPDNNVLLDEYLKKLPSDSILTVPVLRLIQSYTTDTNSYSFKFWLGHEMKIRQILFKSFCGARNKFWYHALINNVLYSAFKQIEKEKKSSQGFKAYQEVIMKSESIPAFNDFIITLRKIYPDTVAQSFGWEEEWYFPTSEIVAKYKAQYTIQKEDIKHIAAVFKYADGLMKKSIPGIKQMDTAFLKMMIQNCENCEAVKNKERKCIVAITSRRSNMNRISLYYAEELNEAAAFVLKYGTERSQFNAALTWAKRAFNLDNNVEYKDTYKQIYDRVNRTLKWPGKENF